MEQLWRRFSLNMTAADGICSVINPQARRFCFLSQFVSDTRYWMAAGPGTLLPGESTTFIIAQINAAAVAAPILARGWPVLQPIVPRLPIEGARLRAGSDTVRAIDTIAGWQSHADLDGDNVIEMHEVTTMPRSLYHKVQYANLVAANRFLLPSPPDPPAFQLVPEDGQVTITWQRSATETTGDPFFPLASAPLATLDREFRASDVEGYRIWRGTSPSDLRLLAQFDYDTTHFVDRTGLLDYGPLCAPEHGITSSCPAFPKAVPIAGTLVQVVPGGRVLLAGNRVSIRRTDTLMAGFPPLTDTGVPFTFTDTGLVNGRVYYYAVTAFDVNSVRSGASSLESPRVLQSVRSRVGADPAATRVHTVPDPYYVDAGTAGVRENRLRFVNLPANAIVRIYSSSGVLVALLNHNDATDGGEAWWDLKNRGGRRVASGVYFYHVETPDGQRRVGRFVVIS